MGVWRRVQPAKGGAAKVEPPVSPSLEPLEPRLLLSADFIGAEMPSPLEPSRDECAIHVDLDRQDEQLPESDPPLVLSYLALAQDQEDVANPVESTPSGAGALPSAEDQRATMVETPVESEGLTVQFQDESSCPIAVGQQDATAGAEFLPIEARGPPVQGAVGANASSSQTLELFGVSPALFVENQGQWADSSVRYVHDGASMDVAVTDSGVRFRASMSDPVEGEDPAGPAASEHGPFQANDTNTKVLQFSASFVRARTLQPVGLEPSGSVFNYYLGDQANWRQNVPSYEIVASEGLYEGIDLHIQGLRSHLKYEFHVAPGADFSQIAVRYEGIEGLSIAEDGSLEVDLGGSWGVIRDDAPYISYGAETHRRVTRVISGGWLRNRGER